MSLGLQDLFETMRMTGQTAQHPRGLNNGGFDIDQATMFSALQMLFYRPAFGG